MAAPVMTFGSPGNLRAAASMAANGTTNIDFDVSSKAEALITVKSTPGTLGSPKGLRCTFLPRYGNVPDVATIPYTRVELPSETASTAESRTFRIPTGRWRLNLQNIDTVNALNTVEVTMDTIDGIE